MITVWLVEPTHMAAVVVVAVRLSGLGPVERFAGGGRNKPLWPLSGLSQSNIFISDISYKPKELHNGEYPDGHDYGDDDDLVHVGEGHHDEVSIGRVIVHFYHPPDQLSCAVVQSPLISNWEISTFWFVGEQSFLKLGRNFITETVNTGELLRTDWVVVG